MTFRCRARACTPLGGLALALLCAGCQGDRAGEDARGGAHGLEPGAADELVDRSATLAGTASGGSDGAHAEEPASEGRAGSDSLPGDVEATPVEGGGSAPVGVVVPQCTRPDREPATAVTAQEAAFEVVPELEREGYVGGDTVALEGDTLAVSATRAADPIVHGTVSVFTRGADGWSRQAELAPPEGEPDAWFGKALALSGDTLVVSAPEQFFGAPLPGRVHVFVRQDGSWHHEVTLGSERPNVHDGFGYAMALSGDTLAVVGSEEQDGRFHGRIELFERGVEGWQRSQTIEEFPEGAESTAGTSVYSLALEGDTLAAAIVPAIDDPGQRIQLFERGVNGFEPTAQLTGDLPGELFGVALVLKGDMLAVGDPYLGTIAAATTQNYAIGGVYLFRRDCDGAWSQTARIQNTEGSPCQDFGRSVALDGARVAIGCPDEGSHASGIDGELGERTFDDDYTGAVYVYGPSEGGYLRLSFLKSPAGVLREKYFGWALAADAGRIAIGARGEDTAYLLR